MSFTLMSPAFQADGPITRPYTCDGDDKSPPLQWSDVPKGTKSLALIMDDPDAPDPAAPKRTFVHWVLYNIPPQSHGLAESVRGKNLPHGTKSGLNDMNRTDYGGPCPPKGRHRYFLKLYALDTVLPDLHYPSKAELERAMKGHLIGYSELMGTYHHA